MMPKYRLTIAGNRTVLPVDPHVTITARRTFTLDVGACSPREAADSIGNRSVADPEDGTWFDEWRILDIRKVRS